MASMAVTLLTQIFSVSISVYFIVFCVFLQGNATEENRSLNTDKQLLVAIVNLFPWKGIFTLPMTWKK